MVQAIFINKDTQKLSNKNIKRGDISMAKKSLTGMILTGMVLAVMTVPLQELIDNITANQTGFHVTIMKYTVGFIWLGYFVLLFKMVREQEV